MRTRMGRVAPMVIVPAMVLALAGCSGDDDSDEGDTADQTETPSSAAPTASETTTPATISPELKQPPALRNASGGVDDVEWEPSSCKTEAGTQTVEGTVTNPSSRPTDYVITISWTNATSDTLGLGFATVQDLAAQDTAPWTLSAEVPDNVSQCVINVRRGQIAGRG